jgi:hypothetical protein
MKTYTLCIESWKSVDKTETGYRFNDLETYEYQIEGYQQARAAAIQAKHKFGPMSQVILRNADGFGYNVTDRNVQRGGR